MANDVQQEETRAFLNERATKDENEASDIDEKLDLSKNKCTSNNTGTTLTTEKDGVNHDNVKDEKIYTTGGKDQGWAWVVAFGAALHIFLLVGFGKSFGLFFVEFIRVYDTNASMMSIILACQTTVLSISSLFVLNFGRKHFGNRKLIIIGGIITSSSYLLNAFAPNIFFLFFSQSFLYGLGAAFTSGPIFVMVNLYFEKRLGLAYSIASIGGSIGTLTVPMIIKSLIEKYGLPGALLVSSGILLNNVVVGFLMRPFPNAPNHSCEILPEEMTLIKKNENEEKPDTSLRNISLSDSIIEIKSEKIKIEDSKSNVLLLTKRIDIVEQQDGSLLLEKVPENEEHKSLKDAVKAKSTTTVDVDGAFIATESIFSRQNILIVKEPTHNILPTTSTSTSLLKHLCQNIIDFSILKNHHFQSKVFAAFFTFSGSVFIMTYIPAFAKDSGIPMDRIALLLTIIGISDLVARIILAWIADLKQIRLNFLLGCALAITGIVSMLNPLYNSFETLLPFGIMYGLFGNIYFTLITIIMRQSVGADKLPAALSMQILIHGLSSLTFAPFLGYLRDLTGSYMVSFYVMATGLLIGSITLLCDPLLLKLEKRRMLKIQSSNKT